MPVFFPPTGRFRPTALVAALCLLFTSLCAFAQSRSLPEVTDIRYWSTPVYTRVAINLQREVRYEAVRGSDPNRVYFDFYGARLSPAVVGQSDRVFGPGFLHHIRAIQLSYNVVRIELDVSSISEYSAFFLSNPARLIIDVHASQSRERAVAQSRRPQSAAPHNTQRYAQQNSQPQTPQPRAVPPPTTPTRIAERNLAPTQTASSSTTPPQRSRSTTVAHMEQSAPRRSANLVRATPQPTYGPVAQHVAGTTPAPEPLIAPPLAAGAVPSMTRALGLKIRRIVIDAGHGGHDSGAIGPGGIEEKNIALSVALRLGDLLRQRLGVQVIYTRDNDTFVPLETRTAIANKDEADLFISIHANASSDPNARGVAVYYLGFTNSADSLAVAARENAASGQSIHDLSRLVRKIALESKLDESRQFATDVDQSLYAGLDAVNPGLPNRGVKRAPFVVLIGANMPSILAEVSFITNPTDASEMEQPAYRERIAESLYRGVAQYVESLDGMRVADDMHTGAR